MKTFKEFLNESKQLGLLYHYTDLTNLISILKTNKLLGSKKEDVRDYKLSYKDKYFISLTRNKNLHLLTDLEDTQVKFDVRITLNGDKLSNNYNIQPYEYEISAVGDEFEERIWFLKNEDSVKDIKKYISQIDIFSNLFDSEEKHFFEEIKSDLGNLISVPIEIDDVNIEDYYSSKQDLLDIENKNEIYKRGKYEYRSDLEKQKFSLENKYIFSTFLNTCRNHFKTEIVSINKDSFILKCLFENSFFNIEVLLNENEIKVFFKNVVEGNESLNYKINFLKQVFKSNYKDIKKIYYD